MTHRPDKRRTTRDCIGTAITAAVTVALLAACGGSEESQPDDDPPPQTSLPAEGGPLTAEELRVALGDEAGDLCQFPASRTRDIDRFREPAPISSVSSYGDWEQAYAQRFGGCIIFSWDESVDSDFLPSMRETLAEQVADEYTYALSAEDERWMLSVRSENPLEFDLWVEDGKRIAELLGRGEPVPPAS